MKPGETTLPVASTRCAAEAPFRSPISAMVLPVIATSARLAGAPVPSTTLPPVMMTSYMVLPFFKRVATLSRSQPARRALFDPGAPEVHARLRLDARDHGH